MLKTQKSCRNIFCGRLQNNKLFFLLFFSVFVHLLPLRNVEKVETKGILEYLKYKEYSLKCKLVEEKKIFCSRPFKLLEKKEKAVWKN